MTALLEALAEEEALLELLVEARHLPSSGSGDAHWGKVL